MNPKDNRFGKILAWLRRDFSPRPITQNELAEKAGLSPAIISNLERGAKTNLEADTLLRLAKALKISPRQLREFLISASPLLPTALPGVDAEQALQTALKMLGGIHLPAFLVDTYDNGLAANEMLLALFPEIEALLHQKQGQPHQFNVLRFVFHAHSPFQTRLLGNSQQYLQQSVSFFQTISLAWRFTNYYQGLRQALEEDEELAALRPYWNNKEQLLAENSLATLNSSFGEISFYSPPIAPIESLFGPLYVIAYLPATRLTLRVFNELGKKCAGQIRLLCDLPPAGILIKHQEIFDEDEDGTE